MLAVLAGATALIVAFVAPAQGKRERHANPGNLGSVLGNAHGGDTIVLASGDYGTFAGAAKKSTVTIKPAPGARATIQLELHSASHLRFVGLTIAGAKIGAPAHDMTIAHSRFTASAQSTRPRWSAPTSSSTATPSRASTCARTASRAA